MKKVKTLRTGAVVTILALLTMCLSGNTFAKYTSTQMGSAGSYIAYWGFDVNLGKLNISNLFDSNMEGVSTWESTGGEDSTSVISMLAPGTHGEAVFALNYGDEEKTPEVDYDFSVEASGTLGESLEQNQGIRFRLDEGEWGTYKELLKSIEALSGDASGKKHYSAGELPAAFGYDDTHVIEWEWDYECEEGAEECIDPDVETYYPNDAVDTVNGEEFFNECNLMIIIKATQTPPEMPETTE